MKAASGARFVLCALSVAVFSIQSLPVRADNSGLQEVVVTAQRRSENLQVVPVSVTALTGQMLSQHQITTPEGLSQFTPSLHIYAETVGSEFYTIRGIGRTSEDLSADPGVAVFLNDVYLPRQAEANLGIYDVDRVEVLKGPQGTLYGKNASAGAIKIITRQPTKQFSGWGQVTGGNYGRINGQGALSGTLVKGLAYGRIAFTSQNRDGLYKNLTTGQSANNIDSQGVRGTLKLTPSDKLTVNLIADWENSKQKGVAKSVIADVPGTLYEFALHSPFGTLRPGINPPTQESDLLTTRAAINGKEGLKTYGGMANIQYAGKYFDVISITGIRSEKDYSLEDNGQQSTVTAFTQTSEHSWSASEELRLESNRPNRPGSENRLSWTAGFYFFHEHGSKTVNRNWNIFPFASIATFDEHINTDSYAVFGEAKYRILDRVSLTAGLRYTTERKKFSVDASVMPTPGLMAVIPGSPFVDAPYSASASHTWDKLTPRVVLGYQMTDDIFAYASFSQGFKSGGFNGEPGSPPIPAFAPEDVTNYEIGLKTELFNRRLRFNFAAFYSDYNNLQLQTFTALGLPTTSTADARSKGIEIETQARVTDALTVSAGLSLMKPTYRNYVAVQPGFSDLAHTFNDDGKRIGAIPEYQFNATADYVVPIGSLGTLDLQGDVVSVDKTVTAYDSLWSPAYTKGDLRLIWNVPGNHWTVTGWVNNVSDNLYYRGGGPISKYNTRIVRIGLINDPRTYGVTVRYNFGQ